MHNLLIETIVRQANAGAFGDLGSVESVDIENGSGSVFTYGGSSSSSSGTVIPFLPLIIGVLAALLVAICVYWFCFRDRGESDITPKDQNGDTSDEEHYTSGDDEEVDIQRQGTIPEAQVVAVEDTVVVKTEDAKNDEEGCS
jgi:hypothetical protein